MCGYVMNILQALLNWTKPAVFEETDTYLVNPTWLSRIRLGEDLRNLVKSDGVGKFRRVGMYVTNVRV